MDGETSVFGLLTVGVVAGVAVLLYGVADHMNLLVIGAGSAVMVAGILLMAGYVSLLPEPEDHESGAHH